MASRDDFRCYRNYGDELYVLDDTYTGDIFLIFSKVKDRDNTYVCVELMLEHSDSLKTEIDEIILFEKILEKIICSKIVKKDDTPIESIIEFYLP